MLRRISTLSALVVASFLFSQSAPAKTKTLGTVYPIQEIDAIEEITAAAQKAQENPIDASPQQWGALQPHQLPPASISGIRSHTPWYTVPEPIKDAKGRVVYPRDFRFNPLVHVRIPNRLVIASEQTLPLVVDQLRTTDQLILCHGNFFEVGRRLDRPIFILQRELIERLGLTHQPSIVEQVGDKFLITEVASERRPHGR